jgi:hypothetical protein
MHVCDQGGCDLLELLGLQEQAHAAQSKDRRTTKRPTVCMPAVSVHNTHFATGCDCYAILTAMQNPHRCQAQPTAAMGRVELVNHILPKPAKVACHA